MYWNGVYECLSVSKRHACGYLKRLHMLHSRSGSSTHPSFRVIMEVPGRRSESLNLYCVPVIPLRIPIIMYISYNATAKIYSYGNVVIFRHDCASWLVSGVVPVVRIHASARSMFRHERNFLGNLLIRRWLYNSLSRCFEQ